MKMVMRMMNENGDDGDDVNDDVHNVSTKYSPEQQVQDKLVSLSLTN